jgi:hypothetical protein
MPNEQPNPQSDLKPEGSTPVQIDDIAKFFASMAGFFPMWKLEPSDENLALWYTNLSPFTMNDLRRAYKAIINDGRKSPPSLPEVVRGCKGHLMDTQRRAAARSGPALPPPEPISESAAQANRERLKRILNNMDPEPITNHGISPKFQARLREINDGMPLYLGQAIHPDYIPSQTEAAAYRQELIDWEDARHGSR